MTEEKEQLNNILSACSTNTEITSKTFFPDRFYMPFAR
jgi:hypothetical protein